MPPLLMEQLRIHSHNASTLDDLPWKIFRFDEVACLAQAQLKLAGRYCRTRLSNRGASTFVRINLGYARNLMLVFINLTALFDIPENLHIFEFP